MNDIEQCTNVIQSKHKQSFVCQSVWQTKLYSLQSYTWHTRNNIATYMYVHYGSWGSKYSSLHCKFCGKKKNKIPLPVFWLCRVCAMHNTGKTYGLATTVHVQLLQHYSLYYLIYILCMILYLFADWPYSQIKILHTERLYSYHYWPLLPCIFRNFPIKPVTFPIANRNTFLKTYQ